MVSRSMYCNKLPENSDSDVQITLKLDMMSHHYGHLRDCSVPGFGQPEQRQRNVHVVNFLDRVIIFGQTGISLKRF